MPSHLGLLIRITHNYSFIPSQLGRISYSQTIPITAHFCILISQSFLNTMKKLLFPFRLFPLIEPSSSPLKIAPPPISAHAHCLNHLNDLSSISSFNCRPKTIFLIIILIPTPCEYLWIHTSPINKVCIIAWHFFLFNNYSYLCP